MYGPLFDKKIMSNISDASSKDYNEFWYDDGIELVGNPIGAADTVPLTFLGGAGKDTLSFETPVYTSSGVPGGQGEDHISLSIPDFPTKRPRWKYNEETILKELSDYITGTYNQHYSAGTDKVQTLDLIEACGDGESFCRSNILKYASRYDKKGTARRDILKILHYAVLLLHFNDKNAKRETYPQ
jgi:hypothetical protein|tara:strand:- start:248 stop:802 length:555 start_codon:yes stop_codon:yes gene_type:complete